jgi:hypothetical protein
MSRLVVHVETLIIRGVRLEDRQAVSAGIQKELSTLLSAPGAGVRLARLGTLHTVAVGEVVVVSGSKPAQVGATAARGIVGRLLP